MNENGNASDFPRATSTPRGCERAEEFVTYLYGEATPEESGDFRRHLESCAVCREEFAALGGVREAFGVWRAEALGSVPSLDISEALAPAAVSRPAFERKRSASAALREFFTLAPLWLRAGAFAATLALCALTALTLSRAEVRWDAGGLAFRTGVAERVVVGQAPTPARKDVYTEEQLNSIVAQRVAEAAARSEEQRQPPTREGVVKVADRDDDKSRRQPAGASTNAPRRKRPARPGPRGDEPLLAEDNLPRLSDLLDGSY